jgi:hypothetical protein
MKSALQARERFGKLGFYGSPPQSCGVGTVEGPNVGPLLTLAAEVRCYGAGDAGE